MAVRLQTRVQIYLACFILSVSTLGCGAVTGGSTTFPSVTPTSLNETMAAQAEQSAIIQTRIKTQQPIATPARTNTILPSATFTATGLGPTPAESIVLPGFVPQGARARIGRGVINQVAVSPDGKTFAVAGRMGLFLYGTETYEIIWSVPTNKSLEEIVFSADGKTIAAAVECYFELHYAFNGGPGPGCIDHREIIIINSADGALLHRIDLGIGKEGTYLEGIGLSTDGKELYVAIQYEGITVLDSKSGEQLRIYPVLHTGYSNCVTFSSDGKFAAIGFGTFGMIDILDLMSGKTLSTLTVEQSPTSALAFSPNGTRIAVGENSTVVLWNIENGKEELILNGSKGAISSLTFSPDGRRIVSGDKSGFVIQWDAIDGHSLRVYTNQGGVINSVGFFPDGVEMLSAVNDSVAFWNTVSGTLIHKLGTAFSDWKAARYAQNGTELVLKTDGKLMFLNTKDYSNKKELEFPTMAVLSQDYQMYAEINSNIEIRISETASGKLLYTLKGPEYLGVFFNGPTINDKNFVFSTDNRSVYTIATRDEYSIDAWDIKSGIRIQQYHYGLPENRITFSADGVLVAIGSFAGEHGEGVDVYTTSDGKRINTFWNQLELIFTLSEDNQIIATGCDNYKMAGSLCVYEIPSGNLLVSYPIEWAGDWITSVSISPDEFIIAAGTMTGQVLIWDAPSGQLLHSFNGHTMNVISMSFSPDGKTLATTSADGTLVVWDVTQ